MKPDKSLFGMYAILALVYVILIFIASLISGFGGINIFSHNKAMYFLHFIEFGVLGLLLFMVFYCYGSKNPYLLTFSTAIAIAVLSEVVQLFVSYRTFNPLDIASDGIGVLAALLIIGFVKQSHNRK